jgi:sulfite exporter TauE/SafE
MCGPFVMMRVVGAADGAARGSVLGRVGQAVLWRYHLGRATTYTALGAATAGAAGAALDWVGFRWLLAAILVAVAAALVLRTVRGMSVAAPGAVSHVIAGIVGRAGRLGDFPLGLALGLLPCGVLYGALAAAASTGSAVTGAVAMASFALGTAPGLIAVGIGGTFFARRFRHARLATVSLLALNVAILTAFALKAIA